MESNQTIPARQAYDTLLPVERKFFWCNQPLFGRNIAGQITDLLGGLSLDGMRLVSSDDRVAPKVTHSRDEKIDFIRRSIASRLDLTAAEAIKSMRDMIDWLDTLTTADRLAKMSDIGECGRHVNSGLDAAYRGYLDPLKMAGSLTVGCGEPYLAYWLGLTDELRSNIEVCVKTYIRNARISLANAMRHCMEVAAEAKVNIPAASLSVR